MEEFAACWEGLEDPRTGNAGLHDLHELLMIALCTVLSGGQGAVDISLFAKSKEPFLRGFLKLKNGPPSHDTFSRLFRLLDPAQFGAVFQRFMAAFSKGIEGWWPSTARSCAARSIAPAASCPCTWSAPGAASNQTTDKTTTETAYYLLSAPLSPNASMRSFARTGASRTVCTGGSMSS